ncbi:MAG: 3-phosphoserine/phosphohydroxythreonine transaminase [Pseudomonadota bacterium]
MSRVYNFSAGPAMLPEEVLKVAQKELLDWHGLGTSIMEVGHRGADFKKVADQSEADLRELMNIPDNYHVLFLAGGATAHFAMIPLNLLGKKTSADYVDTGIWSKKAIEEAKRYGTVNIAAATKIVDGIAEIPAERNWNLNHDAAYLHYTPNETIEGIEFNFVPKVNKHVPLVADMSSMILSRPCDVTEFGVIYAGAQKNMGQAGITVAIIHNDLIKDPLPFTPTLYNYKIEAENKSLYNTPPTYSWYIAGLVLAWMKKMGGIKYFTEVNQRKAKKLYKVIDTHSDFYINKIKLDCRSQMNVPFDLPNAELTEKFLAQAGKEGMVNLKGHRLAGGVRASIYNAMPEAGVDLLVEFMKEFVKKA